jgi:hypothetical protein
MAKKCKHDGYRDTATRVQIQTLESVLEHKTLAQHFKLILRQERRKRLGT